MRCALILALVISLLPQANAQPSPTSSPLAESSCGDGVVTGSEACDDGNTASGDGCRADCAKIERCGDGSNDVGEGCDDGNTLSNDGCSASCFPENHFCGDGVADSGEICDDGNTLSNDGCSASCTLEATCGNGVVEMGESCDDGNRLDGDSCPSFCVGSVERKSPQRARQLAIRGTLAGGLSVVPIVGFFFSPALIVGPSAGHIYAHEYGHAIVLSLARAAAPFAIGGAYIGITGDDGFGVFFALAIGTPVVWAGLDIYDIMDAPRAAERYNERLKLPPKTRAAFLSKTLPARSLGVALLPTPLPAATGRTSPGLSLVGHF